jgi:hypothetical protein
MKKSDTQNMKPEYKIKEIKIWHFGMVNTQVFV